MIRFEYTDNYKYTCRDCVKCNTCDVTKHGKEQNRLPCIDATFEPRQPKLSVSSWDYIQLKRQVSNMRNIINHKKQMIMMSDMASPTLNTENIDRHTFTHYCAFEKALKSYLDFLVDNQEYGDNAGFMESMIKTIVRLEDNGNIVVASQNKKIKPYIKQVLENEGYRYGEDISLDKNVNEM